MRYRLGRAARNRKSGDAEQGAKAPRLRHQVGERIGVEMREDSRERPAERALQTADAATRAGRGRGSHEFDQPVQILEMAPHCPDPHLARLPPTPAPAPP